MHRCLPFALGLAATLAAQQPAELPRMLQLGPLPHAAATVDLHAGGTLRSDAGAALDLAALRGLLAKQPQPLLLRIDAQVPFAVAEAVLDACREMDVAEVQIAAMLPNGRPGAFTLALPRHGDVATSIDLRLHRERPGVPPNSVTPLLARLQRGGGGTPFVLGVEAPGDAPFEQVLQALVAIADAEVPQVVLRAAPTPTQQTALAPPQHDLTALAQAAPAAAPLALAIDLGPSPHLQVEPRALPVATPAVQSVRFGCTERAQVGLAPDETRFGAGGRYGSRLARGHALALGASIASAGAWLTQQQAANGAFADTGDRADVAGTALTLLAFLGDGSTLRSGSYRDALRSGIGWLLARQQTDGSLGTSMRDHALATYALAEAYGLSDEPLLRGGLEDALAWLASHQRADGSFGDGRAGEVATTAFALTAVVSGQVFKLPPRVDLDAASGWLDTAEMRTAADRAAVLFCRFFTGHDPKQMPATVRTADGLLGADPADPLAAYWTTHALYQMGGQHWAQWSRQLADMADAQLQDGAERGAWIPPAGGSQLHTTALRMLSLEAYYRYTRMVR